MGNLIPCVGIVALSWSRVAANKAVVVQVERLGVLELVY